MRMAVALGCVVVLSAAGRTQTQTLTVRPPAVQYVTVESTASAPSVVPGGLVTLWADVTPRRNIHVYAAGASGFTPVSLVMTPNPRAAFGKPGLPAGRPMRTLGVAEPVPVYREKFRIAQPVTVSRSLAAGETLRLAGALNYQACDDTICYTASSLSIIWTLLVK